MSNYLSIPLQKIDVVPLGINLEGFAQAHASRRRDRSRLGIWPESRPRRGCTHCAMPTCDSGNGRVSTAPGWKLPDILRPISRAYLTDAERRLADAGLGGEFHYRGSLDRDRKDRVSEEPRRVFGADARMWSRRGCFCSRRWRAACRSFSQDTERFRRCWRRRRGACSWMPGSADSLADGLYTLWKDPALRARLGQRGFDGVRQHYSIATICGPDARGLREVDVLNVSGVGKAYPAPQGHVAVLSDISVSLSAGDAAVIMGPSGSGKSTLLYIARRARAADDRHGDARRHESRSPSPRRSSRRFETRKSGSCSRIIACCRSAASWRTC